MLKPENVLSTARMDRLKTHREGGFPKAECFLFKVLEITTRIRLFSKSSLPPLPSETQASTRLAGQCIDDVLTLRAQAEEGQLHLRCDERTSVSLGALERDARAIPVSRCVPDTLRAR